jgi:hypothetical protein
VVDEHLGVVQPVQCEFVLGCDECFEGHCEGRNDCKQNDHQILHLVKVIQVMEELHAKFWGCLS